MNQKNENKGVKMKEQILAYIKKTGGGVTYVELCRHIEGFSGDLAHVVGKYKNIIFWQGVSREGAESLVALVNENKITPAQTSALTYAIDGEVSTLPIAKGLRKYKSPRWLPTVYNLVR
jgi:hypothetical protein